MYCVFVINLDKDIERMQFMHEQLTQLNIPYRRQAAVYGKTHVANSVEYDDESAVAATGHSLLPGELGCALSHAAVYEKIVNEQIPFSVVFEDDVELPLNFKAVIEEMVSEQTDSKFEYLLFDYVPVGLPFVRQWFRSVNVHIRSRSKISLLKGLGALIYAFIKIWYIIPLSFFEGVRDAYKRHSPGPVRFFRPVYYAGAYLVTLEGAKKLHSMSKPVLYTADQLPNRARILKDLKFYCYSPLLVKQKRTTFGSSILNLTGAEVKAMYNDEMYS